MDEFINKIKTPKRRIYTRTEIQSCIVPLIIFLNYTFGWERVKSYFPENEIEFSEKRIPNTNKLSIKFYNGYLYYNQYPINGTMLLNGLANIETEKYNYEDLNNQNLYLEYLEAEFGTKNNVKGWITAKEMMLDFKTLQILEELNLPTDLLEVFLYCNDLLVDNQVKDESDVSNYRIRGSEIITECLYKELCERYNDYKKRSGKKLTISMPQNAIMTRIYKTQIVENYTSLSPLGEIKSYSSTTFKGPGGTKVEQAFTQEKRAYNDSYYGTFGISTPDNGNAGIVKELTLNPKIINTLGFIGEQDMNDVNLSDISTVEEAITPFVNKVDDPSRIAFVSIQTAHVGGLEKSSLPPVRTGIEKTIQYQIGDKFCKKAKQDGKIIDINEVTKKIYIEYKDGTKDCVDFTNKIIKNTDAFNEATFAPMVKIGDKVKTGDVLVADNRFFKKDPFTNEIVYTQARNAMIAIHEGAYTEDDSSLITESLSNNLGMNMTVRKTIVIKPKDTLFEYKKIGEYLNVGDPVLVFDDSDLNTDVDTDFDDFFGDMDLESLGEIIHQTPKSNATGYIRDIRVYWTVPIDQMSKSVANFVKEYVTRVKKEIIEEEKFTGRPSPKRLLIDISKPNRDHINDGKVDVKKGSVVIEYFVGGNDIMSTGDKLTLHSSLKSVVSTVIPEKLEPYKEDGTRIDGIFSFISINARMINSVYLAGFSGKILYDFSKKWAKDFLNEIGEEVPKNPAKKI